MPRIGSKRGIERKLDALAQDPSLKPFADRLRAHAGNFDLKAFIALLERNDLD